MKVLKGFIAINIFLDSKNPNKNHISHFILEKKKQKQYYTQLIVTTLS